MRHNLKNPSNLRNNLPAEWLMKFQRPHINPPAFDDDNAEPSPFNGGTGTRFGPPQPFVDFRD